METNLAATLGIRFHHVGLLTDQPAAAAKALALLGYKVADAVYDPLQDVELRMAEGASPFSTIEVITPVSRDGALAKLVTRRGDYGYHSCYTVANFEATLDALRALGLRVVTVSASKPAILFGGQRVSFHSVEGLGLVEFIEDVA